MRLDSHHHFWNFNREEYPWIDEAKDLLRRNFGPSDLLAVARDSEIDRVISVQARQRIEETRWLLDIARQHTWIAGVVGWVPLAEPNIRGTLEELRGETKLCAVRHVVQDEPDDLFILGSAFGRGISLLREFDLTYDILIYARHLRSTIEFVDRYPEQIFVLDHIAKPTIIASQFDQVWAAEITELAKRQNVACKFSGVATEVREAAWNIATLRPYWETVLQAFGPKRLMFGSDWPVCLLKTDYRRWVATVEELTSCLSPEEQDWIWSTTAESYYRLPCI